jgi:uncharacterized phage protein (TIGR01671 family)
MEYHVMAGALGAVYVAGVDPHDTASISTSNTIYPPVAPVMQYTGLKDKNGAEIWEGDILEGEHYPYAHDGKPNYRAVVEWEAPVFFRVLRCVNPDKRGISDGIGEILDPEEWAQLAVVGNIHENPELLARDGGDNG